MARHDISIDIYTVSMGISTRSESGRARPSRADSDPARSTQTGGSIVAFKLPSHRGLSSVWCVGVVCAGWATAALDEYVSRTLHRTPALSYIAQHIGHFLACDTACFRRSRSPSFTVSLLASLSVPGSAFVPRENKVPFGSVNSARK